MRVIVELFATLGRYLPAAGRKDGAGVDLAEGSTIADLARRLGIPDDVDVLALVNGNECDVSRVLADGETVTLYPPLAGGLAAVVGCAIRRRT